MTAQVMVTTEDGQSLAGSFRVQGGKIQTVPETGFSDLLKDILSSPVRVREKAYSSKDNPVDWLRALPEVYRGSVVRVVLAP